MKDNIPTRVVVRCPRPPRSPILVFIATWIIVASIVVGLLTFDPTSVHKAAWVVAGLIIMLVILEGTMHASKLKSGIIIAHEDRIVRFIDGIGLQLESRLNGKLVGTPMLIPLECIQGIYVHEHIEVTRVTSHVMILCNDSGVAESSPTIARDQIGATHLAKANMKLVPAFRGCALPYRECCMLKEEVAELLRRHR